MPASAPHSRTSPRVTPARRTGVEGWGAHDPLPVDDDEDVGAGALAQLAPAVGEQRLDRAPTPWRARAMTFSAYDVVFRPAVAARSLRVHGTRRPCRRAGSRLRRLRDDVGEAARPVRPSGPAPPVTVNRSRPKAMGSPASRTALALDDAVVVGLGQPEPRNLRSIRSRWRVIAKGFAVDDLGRLEDAVTDRHPVVDRAEGSLPRLDQPSVDPCRHTHGTSLPDLRSLAGQPSMLHQRGSPTDRSPDAQRGSRLSATPGSGLPPDRRAGRP